MPQHVKHSRSLRAVEQINKVTRIQSENQALRPPQGHACCSSGLT